MAKILVVDDIQFIQKSLVNLLNKEGHVCSSVPNGQEAWKSIQNEHYDMIITDIMMPKMDGFELIENIRNLNPPKKDIPIVAISGGSKTIKSDLALDLAHESVDTILKKPFGKADIVNVVNTVLGNNTTTNLS